MKEAVEKLLNERDGLALGICNGFQALIKLGLVPNGKITGQDAQSPTLTFNTINRHISKMVYTKVVSNLSPWLANAELGGVYCNPASHGEGRFVALRNGLISSLLTDRLLHSTVILTVMYLWMKSGISMVHTWLLKVSQAQTEDASVRWHILRDAVTVLLLIYMVSRILRYSNLVLSTSSNA